MTLSVPMIIEAELKNKDNFNLLIHFNFRSHVAIAHPQEKPHLCDSCGKSFGNQVSWIVSSADTLQLIERIHLTLYDVGLLNDPFTFGLHKLDQGTLTEGESVL